MFTTTKPLLALTAADLMSPTVVTIPHDMSLRAAAHLLAQADVSGAPVVDAAGRCIGALSGRDFVTWADRGGQVARRDTRSYECHCSDWQLTRLDALPNELVGQVMTGNPVTVTAVTTIGTLARIMVDAHIHRVFVLDRVGRPVGVISSTDVLAAVARAAQSQGPGAGGLAEEHDHDSFHPRTD
jgi:CBS-domain-containing membrane protein